MPRPCLVADVSAVCFFVGKVCGKLLGRGQEAAAVVANVYNEPFTVGEAHHHCREIAVAEHRREAANVGIADGVGQGGVYYAIVHAESVAQIVALYAVTEI